MAEQNATNQKLLDILKQWQKLEDAAVMSTTEIIKSADNPLIQIVMEIIRQDSVMHRRVQQLIIDHIDNNEFSLNKEDIKEFWDKIEEHDEMERKVIAMAEEAVKHTDAPLIKYLINYLLTDERKHDNLINEMEKLIG